MKICVQNSFREHALIDHPGHEGIRAILNLQPGAAERVEVWDEDFSGRLQILSGDRYYPRIAERLAPQGDPTDLTDTDLKLVRAR